MKKTVKKILLGILLLVIGLPVLWAVYAASSVDDYQFRCTGEADGHEATLFMIYTRYRWWWFIGDRDIVGSIWIEVHRSDSPALSGITRPNYRVQNLGSMKQITIGGDLAGRFSPLSRHLTLNTESLGVFRGFCEDQKPLRL